MLAPVVVFELDGERHAHFLEGSKQRSDAVGINEPAEHHGMRRHQLELGESALDLELGPARSTNAPAGCVEHLGRPSGAGCSCERSPQVVAATGLCQGRVVEACPAGTARGEVHAGRYQAEVKTRARPPGGASAAKTREDCPVPAWSGTTAPGDHEASPNRAHLSGPDPT